MLSVVLGVAFGLGWIPLFVFRTEALQQALPYYSAGERRWVRATPVIVATHVTIACVATSLTAPLPPWRVGLGVALFCSGVAFWFWGRLQIGPLRLTRLPDQAPDALRRNGAFGLVRNPLYFGYLLAAAAPAVVAGRPLLSLTWLACLAVFAIRAEQEERRLHRQLGQAYADYCRDVKRLIPYVW
jgi:protein-S-isoprenylcysteine O-methyltransferase Ste14